MNDLDKQPEIRNCVIQFTEISGLDKSIDTEEYANIIKKITALYDDAIKLYDGNVDKHEGKTFMATFGVPLAHEEDPERAIKSALLFKKKIEEYSKNNKMDLNVRIGINLGPVYAGDVGSNIKKEYTVMGDAVNLAARIMEYAQESQILVGEDIHLVTKPSFQFSEALEFKPHGSISTIKVFNVFGQKSGFIRRRGIEGLKSSLIGRKQELNSLKIYLNDLFVNKFHTLILLGEAGVGKSRLIEEFFTYSLSTALEQAKIVNWCSGHCSPYKEAIYLPFIEIIKQMCNIETDDSEKTIAEKLINYINVNIKEKADEIYPYIAHLLSIKLEARHESKIKFLEPRAMKLQTNVAIVTLLENYASQKPCVYVIDDLYLADPSILEALKFIFEGEQKIPALFILISRPDKETQFWKLKEELKKNIAIKEIYLERLDKTEIKQITENLLKIPRLPQSIIAEIITKAGGNPFFLEESIKLLIAKKVLYKKGDSWCAKDTVISSSIPYAIESVIRSRLDTLNPNLKTTLEEMAIIGRNFSKKILRAFSSQWEMLDDIINKIKELGFISSDNDLNFSFDHRLVRDVIYSSIPEKRKKSLHLKIGETIEELYKDRLAEFYEILFEHFHHTDRHEKTIEFGLKSAQNASKKFANDEAIDFYLIVLGELDYLKNNKEQKRNVLIELGKIHSLIGKNEEAFEFFNKALQFCKDKKQESDNYKCIADAYQKVSEYEKAKELYNSALGKLPEASKIEKCSIQLGIAWVNYLQGDYQTAHEILEDILTEIGGDTDIAARKILARTYNIIATLYKYSGDRENSFSYYNKALKLYEILDNIAGQSVIYNNICGYYTDQGNFYNALNYLEKSLELAQKTGNMLSQTISIYNIGETYYQLGDLEKAEAKFNKYLEINSQINNRLGNGYGNWGLGLICMETEMFKEAENYFNKALSIFHELGSRTLALRVMLAIAHLYLLQNIFDKAWDLCEKIITAAKKINDHELITATKSMLANIRINQALVDKKLAINYLLEAKSLLEEIDKNIEEDIETRFQSYFYLSRVHYYLGNPDETMKFFKNASDIHEGILKFIPNGEAKSKLLNRRLYRDFEMFKKELKF